MSSKSTTSSRRSRERVRKTSIQTEVSTSTTGARPVDAAVFANDGEAFPKARSGKVENLPGPRPLHHLAQRALDRARVRSLAAHAGGLLEQCLVQHKMVRFIHIECATARPPVEAFGVVTTQLTTKTGPAR
jgi:hypothetical protein